ncbi:hypothetical protein Tco_0576367 [Tanacetum coccineum]
MSHSTISYESIAESMGSSVPSAMVPYPAPAADLESEPFEDPASPVASDFNSVVPSFNFDLLSDRVSPTVSAASDDEPLGSPDTTDYYGGSEFSKDDPSEDGSIGASSDDGKTAAAPPVPLPPPSPLSLLSSYLPIPSPAHSGPSRRRSRPSLPPDAPHSSSPPYKRCRVSPTPTLPAARELAVIALALPSVTIELLPHRKRFTAIESDMSLCGVYF